MVLCALRAFFVRFVVKYNIIPMNVTRYNKGIEQTIE